MVEMFYERGLSLQSKNQTALGLLSLDVEIRFNWLVAALTINNSVQLK